ncbi:hypothetical protein [Gordonia phthalatica]|uniref:DUF5642 domain-containing protein n=1 Tax=Gordonia phthalatica TaxID=1136941 RepID=A0A0N9N825_9ACTN|nr:hypothetical protein [Gordonia phthalatica]ALG83301.1 hypothetical protein ACH46_00730 [Gordonia phthalatica]
MSRFATRLGTALLAATAITALATGCSSDSGGHSAVDLVLTQSELPDGFTVAKLGKDELAQVTDQLHDSTKNVETKPAKCAAPGSMVSSIDAKTTGVMAATSAKFAISQSVQPVDQVDGGVDLAKTRDRVTGKCAQVHVTVTSGPIKGAEIDVRHTIVNASDIDDADQLLVVESTSHTVNGAKSGTKDLIVGTAVTSGFVITVEMTAAEDSSGPLDRDLFTTVLGRAVEKAARA